MSGRIASIGSKGAAAALLITNGSCPVRLTTVEKSKGMVLVVEDEALVRMNATDIITDAGYEVIEVCNADEAICILEARNDIRFIFTDIDMPGSMDGLKLAHAVRNRWPPVKIIVTSGHNSPSKNDLPLGGLFLSKPYTPHDVCRMLEAA